MKNLQRYILFFLVIFSTGCPSPEKNYKGNVQINRTNGNITSVTITLPYGEKHLVNNKKDLQAFRQQLESMLRDIEIAHNEMED